MEFSTITCMNKWILVTLICGLTACTPTAMMEKFTDKEKVQIARTYIQRLIDGDVAALAAELDPGLRTGTEVEQLTQMRALIPAGAPSVTEVVGYNVNHLNGVPSYNVTFQFGFGAKWLLINAAWREQSNAPRVVIGMRAVPLERSLQETNAFNFRNARLIHYLVLGAALLNPLFVLISLVACLRTPFARRKWLWVIFVLCGFVQFSLNWTTGATDFRLISVQLFGAGVMASSPFSPWILSVSFPIGAIAFWFKRRHLLKVQPPPLPAQQDLI
jgi:hypothetical protein